MSQNLRFQTDSSWQQLFGALERNGQALNIQIRRILVGAIEAGHLPAHSRLPSSRQLAPLLGIGRNTVTSAYQLLVDEGFLVSRARSGIFVADLPLKSVSVRAVQPKTPIDWAHRFTFKPSDMPQISKPKDWRRYPYPFLSGQFDSGLFPTNNWREAVKATSSVAEIQSWAGDMIDDDDPDLVEQLRNQVLPQRGILATSGEIIVTIGSQQALSMLVHLLAGPQTVVGLEDPGYPDLRNMVQLASTRGVFLTSDSQGVVPDALFAQCGLAFLTTGHQCPTTTVMPLARRQALLEAAARHKVVLVEDDYDADLSIEEAGDLRSLRSLDPTGQVIYVGSFSKVLAPGLRIGYVVAPEPVICELRVLRRLMLRHPPTNNQRSLATFIALGHYRQHLTRVGQAMLERAQLIEKLLPRFLPACRFQRGSGAASFWIEGPTGLDARLLVDLARSQGVLIEAGDISSMILKKGEGSFASGLVSFRQTGSKPV